MCHPRCPACGLTAVLMIVTASVKTPAEFVQPGIYNTMAELRFIKKKITEGKNPWKAGYDKLKNNSLASSGYKPSRIPYYCTYREGGACRPLNDGPFTRDCLAALANAYRGFIEERDAHTNKAIEIFNWYGKSFQDFRGQSGRQMLRIGWALSNMIAAADIVRGTSDTWAPADIEAFKAFGLKGYTRILATEPFCMTCGHPGCQQPEPKPKTSGGNGNAYATASCLAVAVFNRNTELFEAMIKRLRWQLQVKMWKNKYGHYQAPEMCRDGTHDLMGMYAYARALETAYIQGVDLYGYDDNKFAKVVENTGKYSTGSGAIPIDCCGKKGSASRGGRLDQGGQVFEIVYNHYHHRRALDMPNSLKARNRTRPTGYKPHVGIFPTTFSHADLNAPGNLPVRATSLVRGNRAGKTMSIPRDRSNSPYAVMNMLGQKIPVCLYGNHEYAGTVTAGAMPGRDGSNIIISLIPGEDPRGGK